MSHGFLGYQSTFMLDFVVTALTLIVPALSVSVFLVKVRRNYVAHRNLQLVLGGVLLAARRRTSRKTSTVARLKRARAP